MVCKPEEALACFLRTRMDMLVMGDFVIERSDAAQAGASQALAAAPTST